MKYLKMVSPLGPLWLSASAQGLTEVRLSPPSPQSLSPSEDDRAAQSILRQATRELEEYFAGKRQVFEVPLDPQGTNFQKKVWRALSRIPYGRTCSYRDLATDIQHAKAVRAVGGANGRNPLCIIVPCHRVIAADGSLGGYSGGLHVKAKLLALERGEG